MMEARRRCAVLGSPISHSLSPVLHRAAYEYLRLDWQYDPYDIDEASLPNFMANLDETWAGLSITMPLKRAIIPLCDDVSGLANLVSAVNTVIFRPDGTRFGENTDVPGMVAALREAGVESVPAAAVLGGGATAISAIAALLEVGTGEIDVYVRSSVRAVETTSAAARIGAPVKVQQWDGAANALAAPLVISTTPAGATDHLAGHVEHDAGVLLDVVYDPWPTRLAAAWNAHGGRIIGGLDQLVHQAVPQVELMTGLPVDYDELVKRMRAAAHEALAAR
jgi:shikimate dehydrogenase